MVILGDRFPLPKHGLLEEYVQCSRWWRRHKPFQEGPPGITRSDVL